MIKASFKGPPSLLNKLECESRIAKNARTEKPRGEVTPGRGSSSTGLSVRRCSRGGSCGRISRAGRTGASVSRSCSSSINSDSNSLRRENSSKKNCAGRNATKDIPPPVNALHRSVIGRHLHKFKKAHVGSVRGIGRSGGGGGIGSCSRSVGSTGSSVSGGSRCCVCRGSIGSTTVFDNLGTSGGCLLEALFGFC